VDETDRAQRQRGARRRRDGDADPHGHDDRIEDIVDRPRTPRGDIDAIDHVPRGLAGRRRPIARHRGRVEHHQPAGRGALGIGAEELARRVEQHAAIDRGAAHHVIDWSLRLGGRQRP